MSTRESTGPAAAAKDTSDAVRRPEAFDANVLEHMEMLYAVAMRLTRNVNDAQDLTQNTILKALRFHSKFKEGTYIKAWLLTILRNTFINEYRQRVRRPSFVELTGGEPAPPPSSDPDVPFELHEITYKDFLDLLDDEVKDAIEGLPEEFKTAVVMADIEDKSYKEIADVMGCPLGTVMSRLYRGRKLMRAQLQQYAEHYGIVARTGKSKQRVKSLAVDTDAS